MAGDKKKTPVVGIVERKGRAVARVVADSVQKRNPSQVLRVNTFFLKAPYIRTNLAATTDCGRFRRMGSRCGYQHRRINHSSKVYVMGDIHTNSVEGFWSLIKRGIGGVYHSGEPEVFAELS